MKRPGRPRAVRQSKETGAHAPVFFRPSIGAPQISRCGKFFCVVKNRAARHKTAYCNMEKVFS
ncbi:hypothetical protein E2553_01250 [Paraburkholderia dipogonis]|uniref:Uncharacterized protein n=1 Tax=Paraburkholderia dipogonis TaxID=1211383 RepID=A0A4Y8N2G2_9BURK|nr:hypothetical protein E2553_01250 [Paraburkholderia dipogonis]